MAPLDDDISSGGHEAGLPVSQPSFNSLSDSSKDGGSNGALQFVESPTREKFDLSKGLPSHM